jgi:hypothetical protein
MQQWCLQPNNGAHARLVPEQLDHSTRWARPPLNVSPMGLPTSLIDISHLRLSKMSYIFEFWEQCFGFRCVLSCGQCQIKKDSRRGLTVHQSRR